MSDEKLHTPGTPTHHQGVGRRRTERRRARNVFRNYRLAHGTKNYPSFKAWWSDMETP